MSSCINCDFYDSDYGCLSPSSDRWYICPLENQKPENVEALIEYAVQLSQNDNNRK